MPDSTFNRPDVSRPVAPNDNCPDCLARAVKPWRSWLADATKDVTLYGDYRCYKCGHAWWCGWNPGSLA